MENEKSVTINVKDNQIEIQTDMQPYEVVGLLTSVLQHYQVENIYPSISKMVDELLLEKHQEEK